jgi:hypothetical protein
MHRIMSAPRLAAWIIGAAVCGAWLASAAGVTRQARVTPTAPPAADVVQLDALAADVQAQASRLRERLAQAPAPNSTPRNPFRFAPTPSPRQVRAATLSHGTPDPPAIDITMPPAEPTLDLVGVAESSTADGLVRTAMMTGETGDLIMAVAGQRILGRYDVVAIDAGAVELKDVQTGKVRRLVLR